MKVPKINSEETQFHTTSTYLLHKKASDNTIKRPFNFAIKGLLICTAVATSILISQIAQSKAVQPSITMIEKSKVINNKTTYNCK
ncbi:hypothetical protein ACQKMD_10920 [Viridibacillus sp. NPDC096237]|uniref:hypothetical protein n=1 Tax=Viridibacillus sp. NPDC096237 TaxID=3390721 RepID=UPI003D054CD2